MISIDAISRWSTIRNCCDCKVIVDGWQAVQIPAGHGGWDAVGQGTLTLYDRGFRGGKIEAADSVCFGVIFWR